MAGSLRQVLQSYSEICIFLSCDSICSVSETVSGICTRSVVRIFGSCFDEAHFLVNLHSFLQTVALTRQTVLLSESFVRHLPCLPGRTSSKSHLLQTHSNSLSVYIFLNSQPQPGKSKEFNNQGLEVNRNFKGYFLFFYHQKTIKNRQGMHEIIWALSLSIIFVEFSFKPVYPTMIVKI